MDKSATDPEQPERPAGREAGPRRQTVQVAKEHVTLAKKVAVLRGETVENFSKELLDECAEDVEREVSKAGPLGVRDRAEALNLSAVPKGTFNTDPEVVTRINILAGQCLTSAAKLLDPYLRTRLKAAYKHEIDWIETARSFGDDASPGVRLFRKAWRTATNNFHWEIVRMVELRAQEEGIPLESMRADYAEYLAREFGKVAPAFVTGLLDLMRGSTSRPAADLFTHQSPATPEAGGGAEGRKAGTGKLAPRDQAKPKGRRKKP